jgi:tetratricopeptide (TPR) repeat protein
MTLPAVRQRLGLSRVRKAGETLKSPSHSERGFRRRSDNQTPHCAASLNQRTLAIDRQIYGTTHPRIADSLINLGEIQHDLGHDADAEKYYREVLTIKKSWYGEVHSDTATCMAAVGQSLVYQGKYDEAAPFLARALAIQEQVYGKAHPQVAIALNQVGVLELRRKHMDAALADFMRLRRNQSCRLWRSALSCRRSFDQRGRSEF